MGEVAAIYLKRTSIEMNHPSSAMAGAPPSRKTERKVIEKMRRNQMKTLYSNLNSLLPENASRLQEAVPLPDQIDGAINYIKYLEENLKKLKEKKESLSASTRSSLSYSDFCESTTSKPPQLEIRAVGSALHIVLITGLDNQFLFHDIVRILHQEGVDIASANYSLAGNSVLHVVHAEIRESDFSFGAVKVTEKLNRLISGSTCETELASGLWDFDDLEAETWAFQNM